LKVYRVAIFAPIYLDSAFNGEKLRSIKSIPKLMLSGLEFIQGAQIAFDTLNINGKKVEAFIYDTKARTETVSWLLKNKKLDNIDLIIGSVREPEFSLLSQFAVQSKVPFISSTYPNDGGIRDNPYLVVVNSTLKAHCEGIYSYLVQKHGTDNIYLFRKKNDSRIDNYFKEINTAEGKPLLKIKTIMLDSSVSPTGMGYLIDTTKPAVIIGASLDEEFSTKLADACYPLQKTNTLTLIGMPNWDGFRNFYKKNAYTNFPIKYSSPHYDGGANAFSDFLKNQYFKTYRTEPGDMGYKGFESAYYFVNILLHYGDQFMDHLNEPSLASFHEFNFRPVNHNNKSTSIDYFENKRLFIMQILNGESVRQW
ncbi:MAG: ABC transporter substrate-binding protein, partial [Ginsengibacter sp.]